MSVKAGQILHDANGFVVDRIQTGGVGSTNIPEEKIYELGNFKTVATVRDIPDLSFDLESLDVSTEIESLILFRDPTTTSEGDEFDFGESIPLDIISPFKAGQNLYNVLKGVIVPYLTLESVTYRFGLQANATEQFTFRGDAVYYTPGSPYYEEYTHDGVEDTYSLAHTAIAYEEAGDTIHVLAACYVNTDGTYGRLFYGQDYTDTTTNFTLLDPSAIPSGAKIRVVYGSTTAATYPQSVHEDVSVKPAAVRGKDIDVYVGNEDGSVFTRWTSVQSFEVTRRLNLDNDSEFGNHHFVAQDYDTADVTGSISIRPRNPDDLFDKINQVANVPSNEVVGLQTSVGLPVELRVRDPETGVLLKTLYIPDARFQTPGIQGRVQQKTEVTFNFTSDGGTLLVYSGGRYEVPDLTSISPTSGSTSGGTTVTLTGTNLTGTTGVTFGGVAATSVTVVDDTEVTCVTPAHSAGAVAVQVTNPAGNDSLAAAFTYS